MASPFTNQEKTVLLNALDQAIASAKRQQKTGKQPQIQEAYAVAERVLVDLKNKVTDLK